jgi:integrase
MPVYPVKSKGRWRFEFNRVIRGVRTRATKLLPAAWGRAKAEAYDRAETARLYAVAAGLEQPEPPIARAVALYLTHRVPQLRDGRGLAHELAFLAGYIDGRPMSQLADVSREYAAENHDLAPATIRNRLAYLRAACRYAWRRHKLTPHDPTGQMEFPKVDNAKDVRLPVAEYERRILGCIEDLEARALFTLAFYTGSRWPSEIRPRKAEDVHRIVVKRKQRVLLDVKTTKNGRPRLVPVPQKARWALAYLPFKHSERWYYDRYNPVRAAAGLHDIVPHSGRHIVAADILLNDGTLADVSVALHHKHWGSSARYSAMLTEHAERVLNAIHRRTWRAARSPRPCRGCPGSIRIRSRTPCRCCGRTCRPR